MLLGSERKLSAVRGILVFFRVSREKIKVRRVALSIKLGNG